MTRLLLATALLLAACSPIPGTAPGAAAPEEAAEIAAAFGPDGTNPQPWFGKITAVRWSETGGRLIVSGGFGLHDANQICVDIGRATGNSGITIETGFVSAICDLD